MKVQRGDRGIAILFLQLQSQKRVSGQHHALTALPMGKRPVTHCTGGWVSLGASLHG